MDGVPRCAIAPAGPATGLSDVAPHAQSRYAVTIGHVYSRGLGFQVIEVALKRAGLSFGRLDGSMSLAQRDTALAEFRRESTSQTVLLCSLKATGVGINLVVANHCFLMDPW